MQVIAGVGRLSGKTYQLAQEFKKLLKRDPNALLLIDGDDDTRRLICKQYKLPGGSVKSYEKYHRCYRGTQRRIVIDDIELWLAFHFAGKLKAFTVSPTKGIKPLVNENMPEEYRRLIEGEFTKQTKNKK